MTTTDPPLINVAIHEAGHAALCWERGFDVEWVHVQPNEDALGEILFDGAFNRSGPYDRVLGLVAGMAAEHLYTKEYPRGWGHDWNRAWAIAAEAMTDQDEIWHYLDEMNELAAHILQRPAVWSGVTALARALVERKRLSGETARQIYEQGKRWAV